MLHQQLTTGVNKCTVSIANYWGVAHNWTNTQAFVHNTDNYPVFQNLNWYHNNVGLSFDCYWDGSFWRSSHAGSNFKFHKFTNFYLLTMLQVLSGTKVLGSLRTANSLSVDSSGKVFIGN